MHFNILLKISEKYRKLHSPLKHLELNCHLDNFKFSHSLKWYVYPFICVLNNLKYFHRFFLCSFSCYPFNTHGSCCNWEGSNQCSVSPSMSLAQKLFTCLMAQCQSKLVQLIFLEWLYTDTFSEVCFQI